MTTHSNAQRDIAGTFGSIGRGTRRPQPQCVHSHTNTTIMPRGYFKAAIAVMCGLMVALSAGQPSINSDGTGITLNAPNGDVMVSTLLNTAEWML